MPLSRRRTATGAPPTPQAHPFPLPQQEPPAGGQLAGASAAMPISFGVSKGGVGKAGRGRGRGVAASFVQASAEADAAEAEERSAGVAAAAQLQAEGEAAAEAGDFATALGKWNAAVALHPEHPELHELRAQGYLATESWWEAVQAAERAVSLRPGFWAAWITLGRAQLK